MVGSPVRQRPAPQAARLTNITHVINCVIFGVAIQRGASINLEGEWDAPNSLVRVDRLV